MSGGGGRGVRQKVENIRFGRSPRGSPYSDQLEQLFMIDEAIDKVEGSKEKWCEAEVHRIAG
jgi:hypothetical protein